jgi:hypothetical protein
MWSRPSSEVPALRLGTNELRDLISRKLNKAHIVLDEWDVVRTAEEQRSPSRGGAKRYQAKYCVKSVMIKEPTRFLLNSDRKAGVFSSNQSMGFSPGDFVLWLLKAMAESWGKFRVKVVDDEIIVALPGTTYSVTYYKLPSSPQLLAKHISDKDDKRVALKVSEFLSRAWKTANDKARELGWIV